MIDICFLGTLGNIPLPNRHLASLLIKYNGRKILIDCGEGTQVAIRKIGWGFKNIDYIFITHAHGDHIIGLPGLLSTMGNSDRREKVTIIGPEGIKKVIDGLNIVNPYLPYEIDVIENPMEELEILPGIIASCLNLEHSTECLGYSLYFKRVPRFSVEMAEKNKVPKLFWNRLQKGESLVSDGVEYNPAMVLGEERKGVKLSYITDTRPIDEIPKFIEESDLFICEGTYGNDEDINKAIKNKHMTFRESATLAGKGKCKELKITHFSPALTSPMEYINNAKEVFESSSLAYDGEVKTLKFIE